jgi:hypothetical protein
MLRVSSFKFIMNPQLTLPFSYLQRLHFLRKLN